MTRSLLLLLMLALAAPVAAQNVVLLRHAEKADDGTSDPPLTAFGEARAHALIGVLKASGLTATVTSGFQRTVQTAGPAAAYFGATEVVVGVSEGMQAHLEATADTVRSFGPDAVVLVSGHSNTIPRIIHALGGPELPDLNEAEYDLLYFMDLNADEPELRRIYWRPVE
ncbi:MAG: histidine phosphatase family protein [Rhodothermales bacterium]|nr:histidine phosphatase family protein [Rhodothermales bacterium]MBO6779777.1 histidine phosphatase family protein [Rhodothermales bacterium]